MTDPESIHENERGDDKIRVESQDVTPRVERIVQIFGLSANDVLKLSIAISVVIIALVVSYYFIIYMPRKDAVIRATSEARLAKVDQEKMESIDRKKEAYRKCVQSARADYDSNWNINCERISHERLRARSLCYANENVTAEFCMTTYPDVPSVGCTLDLGLAQTLTSGFESAKTRCTTEAQNELSE